MHIITIIIVRSCGIERLQEVVVIVNGLRRVYATDCLVWRHSAELKLILRQLRCSWHVFHLGTRVKRSRSSTILACFLRDLSLMQLIQSLLPRRLIFVSVVSTFVYRSWTSKQWRLRALIWVFSQHRLGLLTNYSFNLDLLRGRGLAVRIWSFLRRSIVLAIFLRHLYINDFIWIGERI